MTNTQKIEASREVRLWITRVVLPTVIFFRVTPVARKYFVDKYKGAKDWVTSRVDYHKANKGMVKE